jgi:hypothetical protein
MLIDKSQTSLVDTITEENCAFDEPKPLNEVQQQPYALDAKLSWSLLDVSNEEQVQNNFFIFGSNIFSYTISPQRWKNYTIY